MISSPTPRSVLPFLPSGRLRRNVTRTLLILKRWACSKLHFYGYQPPVWHHRRLDNGDLATSFYSGTTLYSISSWPVLSPPRRLDEWALCRFFMAPRRARSPGLATADDFGVVATLRWLAQNGREDMTHSNFVLKVFHIISISFLAPDEIC